jgi:tRNA (mo5U34)-methyltransferase
VTTQDRISRLGEWFHNIHLPDGAQTAPHHWLGDFPAWKWEQIAPHIPSDLTGWRVLDIGCNGGYYSFALAQRGASVLGIDVDLRYLTQARWAARQLGLQDRTEFRQMQVYDLARLDEKFDMVLFMGVLYHLRYPLLALDLVAQKTKRLLVFQTLTMPGEEVRLDTWDRHIHDRDDLLQPDWPKMAFFEHAFAGDPTNWWAPNKAGVEAMLRSCGLQCIGEPGHEMWIAQPDPEHPSSSTTWNKDEILSATGRLDGQVRTYQFQSCWVHVAPCWVETVYRDGTRVTAMPEEGESYSALTKELGYGCDTEALSREHEIVHTFLAEALGCGASPTLWAVAHGQEGDVAPVWAQEEEEAGVLAFQAYLNGGPITPALTRLAEQGLDLEELRAEALLLLRS